MVVCQSSQESIDLYIMVVSFITCIIHLVIFLLVDHVVPFYICTKDNYEVYLYFYMCANPCVVRNTMVKGCCSRHEHTLQMIKLIFHIMIFQCKFIWVWCQENNIYHCLPSVLHVVVILPAAAVIRNVNIFVPNILFLHLQAFNMSQFFTNKLIFWNVVSVSNTLSVTRFKADGISPNYTFMLCLYCIKWCRNKKAFV